MIDIGFLLDSSGSLKNNYQDEKDFIKYIVSKLPVAKGDARAAVITFSHYVHHDIKFNSFIKDTKGFNKALDAIPLMNTVTRIDKALKFAHNEMFLEENGHRAGVPKVLILLTDGSQTKRPDSEDPAAIAAKLRQTGVHLLVVGMGRRVIPSELLRIADVESNVFFQPSFDKLTSNEFVGKVLDKTCKKR